MLHVIIMLIKTFTYFLSKTFLLVYPYFFKKGKLGILNLEMSYLRHISIYHNNRAVLSY